jgi:two-component system, chemotaxis family, protein-glutamate methylesterase/glutaminase
VTPEPTIVAIGASAGGLEGLIGIVRDLPPGLPVSIFVVLHLSPSANSHLAEILGKGARYDAVSVHGTQPIEPGRVYVAPPDRHLVIERGRVFASDAPRENHHRPSIDVLFRSAALSYGPRVIGVVLSGTLDDGTAGLRWIKRLGGQAIVQNPAEAQFSGMPASAIRNVEIDRVLDAQQIAAGIADMAGAGNDSSGSEETAMASNGSLDGQGAPHQEASDPSAFVCPDCGGTLFELGADETLRFRCRVGHAYSPEGLHGEQARNLEESLWTAVRSLEEHADLARRLATWAREAQLPIAAERFERNADDSLQKAGVVRRAILAGRTEGEPEDDIA